MLQELALVNNLSDLAENKRCFHSDCGATLPPPLLCFSLSTAAPSSHLGIAQVRPCYLLLNLVQLVRKEKCSINEVADAGREEWRRRINKRAETLSVTISWVRRWRKLFFALQGHHLWRRRRPVELQKFPSGKPRHSVGWGDGRKAGLEHF